MKVHLGEPEAPSLMKWLKKSQPKNTSQKSSIAAKKPSQKKKSHRQITFKIKKQPRDIISLRPKPSSSNPPPPPRLPRSKPYSDLSVFKAPSELIGPDLNTRSPEFRLAHVQYFEKLSLKYPKSKPKLPRKRPYRDQKQKSGLFQLFPVLLKAALQSD